MFGGKTPDITAGQVAAILTFAVTQIVAWNWVSNDQGQVMISAGGAIVAAAWKLADAFLRGKRAEAVLPRASS